MIGLPWYMVHGTCCKWVRPNNARKLCIHSRSISESSSQALGCGQAPGANYTSMGNSGGLRGPKEAPNLNLSSGGGI